MMDPEEATQFQRNILWLAREIRQKDAIEQIREVADHIDSMDSWPGDQDV